jgi:hypothetical protein
VDNFRRDFRKCARDKRLRDFCADEIGVHADISHFAARCPRRGENRCI